MALQWWVRQPSLYRFSRRVMPSVNVRSQSIRGEEDYVKEACAKVTQAPRSGPNESVNSDPPGSQVPAPTHPRMVWA